MKTGRIAAHAAHQPNRDPPGRSRRLACGTAAPVLQTEDGAAFARMLEGIRRDVEPRGLVEDMYVGDVACIVWEMLCLRRYRAALINAEFHAAVKAIAQEMTERCGGATAAQGGRRRSLSSFRDGLCTVAAMLEGILVTLM